MATRKFGVNPGDDEYEVVDSIGSATTRGTELTIDLARVLTRQDALIALSHFRAYLLRGPWPPA